jgi:hypothetical protein
MADPVRKPTPPDSATHAFPPSAWTRDEAERMDEVAAVDPEAALAWMLGEGPDPWPEPSR